MTAPDEPTSKLSEALDGFIADQSDATAEPPPDEPFQMPDIVPATIDRPVPEAPPAPPAPVAPTLPASSPSGPPPITRPVMPPVATPAQAAAPAPTPAGPPAAAVPPATQRATGWSDHMTTAGAPPATGPGLRSARGRPRVRKVTRVVRHVDPWSAFKVALVFSAVTYVVVLTSGVLLWRVADSTGTLDNVERWFTQFGWETFELKGGEIFHNAWIIGLFGAVALTGVAVLTATLFNLVSDIVGGVRMTVLEEEVVERTITSTRRYVVRRPPVSDDTGGIAAPAWSLDDDDSADENGHENEPASDEAAAPTQAIPTVQPAAAPAATDTDWSVDDDEPIAPG